MSVISISKKKTFSRVWIVKSIAKPMDLYSLCIPSLDRSYPNLLFPSANAHRKPYTDNLGVFLGLLALPALSSLEGGSSIFRLIEVQIEKNVPKYQSVKNYYNTQKLSREPAN